jgi:hypothetical protein
MSPRPAPPTKGGFDRTAFTIDWGNQQVTCSQGVTSTVWSECTERGRESIVVRFPVTACQTCPVRPQCTQSTRNNRPPTSGNNAEWKQRYATRAGVEGTIHQAVAATGIRRSRYLGLPKTHLAPPRLLFRL